MKRTDTPTPRPRRSATAKLAHDRKREQILQVAEDLFFRNGYAGATIADITERLGVTKPFVYYYFRNKYDIYETLVLQASLACLTTLDFDESDTRPAIAKLREGLGRFAEASILNFKSSVLHYREPHSLKPTMQRKVRQLARNFHDRMCALLEQGKRDGDLDYDDTKLTALAAGSVVGFLYSWYKPAGKLGPKEVAQKLTNIMLRTIGDRSLAAGSRS